MYADDCNIYVRSRRAGERVMAGVSRFIAGAETADRAEIAPAVQEADSGVDETESRCQLAEDG